MQPASLCYFSCNSIHMKDVGIQVAYIVIIEEVGMVVQKIDKQK